MEIAMSRRRLGLWCLQVLFWIVPGSSLLGAGCQTQLRDSLVAAGADFAGDTATKVLQMLIPVDAMLGGQ
jgi:hypothetical protein